MTQFHTDRWYEYITTFTLPQVGYMWFNEHLVCAFVRKSIWSLSPSMGRRPQGRSCLAR